MSPVARQMVSNTIVAMRDVVQMCFVGFSTQIERAAVVVSRDQTLGRVWPCETILLWLDL